MRLTWFFCMTVLMVAAIYCADRAESTSTASSNQADEPIEQEQQNKIEIVIPSSGLRFNRAELNPFPRIGRAELVPFPRIGRAELVPFPRIGRAELVPFPRIGKADYRMPLLSNTHHSDGGNKHRFTGWQSDDKEIPVIQDYDDDSHPVGDGGVNDQKKNSQTDLNPPIRYYFP